MSLMVLEGFDDGQMKSRWANNGLPALSSGVSRLGFSQTLTAGDWMKYTFKNADRDDFISVGMWSKLQTWLGNPTRNGQGWIQFFGDTGVVQGEIGIDTLGQLFYRSTQTGLILGTSSVVWSAAGTSHYIEVQIRISDTVGTVDVYSDGASVLSLSGIDTRFDASTLYGSVRLYGSNWGGELANMNVDDIYITNEIGAAPYNGMLGGIIVETKFPNGNGNYSNFAGSDGNSVDNYLLVDENPAHDSDTTYVESSTDTDRDSYAFENITAGSGSVLGVMLTAIMRNTGTNDNVQLSTRISATDYDDVTQAVPASYGLVEKLWQVSPATAVDWTIAEFDGSEFGIENVA